MNEEKLNQEAKTIAEQADVLAEAQSALENVNEEWQENADHVLDEARVITEAQSAADLGVEGKPVHPDKRDRELFDDADVLVSAQNAVDNGYDKANRHHLKHLEEADDPDEWNPETVIDEKIKEEQKNGVEEELKDELVRMFE